MSSGVLGVAPGRGIRRGSSRNHEPWARPLKTETRVRIPLGPPNFFVEVFGEASDRSEPQEIAHHLGDSVGLLELRGMSAAIHGLHPGPG